jgi:hypothetical protein
VAEDEVDRSNYAEALDARGLPIVGLEEASGIWEVDRYLSPLPSPLSHWVMLISDSFVLEVVVRETEAIHRALHRAVVETFTLHLNGRNVAEELGFDTPVSADLTESVNISVAENGEARFEYPAAAVEAEILKSLEGDGGAGQVASREKSNVQTEAIEEEVVDVTEEEGVSKDAEELSRLTWLSESLANSGWVQLPLTNPELKFAVCFPFSRLPRL